MGYLNQWLIENGGPSVHLLLNEGDVLQHTKKLMGIDKVKKVVEYLDGFNTEARDRKTLEHLVHFYKESCIENFFPILMHYGFKAGMKPIDDRIDPLRKVFNYFIDSEYHWLYFGYSLMTHQCFFGFGYEFKEVMDSFRQRIRKLHKNAVDKVYDIYTDGEGLPKIPKAFEGRRCIKFEMNPFDCQAERPLPTIYDLRAMSYWGNVAKDSNIKIINDIVDYILTPQFQDIPAGYGLVWTRKRERYHACGWSPTLPYFIERSDNDDERRFLLYMETMSRFPKAKKSDWYKNGLKRLDQYKTCDGTYIFPDEILRMKLAPEAFLSESNMSLKATEKRTKYREVFSTVIMHQLLK